ncbi:glycosyltransferase family 39 protein [bacterium]|nr:glycosyltransferase family 39 protein [bacterium]
MDAKSLGSSCETDEANSFASIDIRPPGEVALLADQGWRHYLPRRQLLLHSFVLCLLAFALLFDVPVATAFNDWYNGPEPLSGELHQLIISLAQYAQPIGFITAAVLMWIFDNRRRGRIVVLATVLLVSGVGSTLIKAVTGRERPCDSNCEVVFHGPVHRWSDSKVASFPSGHTATAFALSCVLASFYPSARRLIWLLAFGVAINRLVTVRHFPSDVVAGAWFGYFTAVWTMQAEWVWKLASKWNPLLSRPIQMPSLMPRNPWPFWRQLLASQWILIAACLAMYWTGNGEYSLWDRDEPRFATATREMIASGEWLVPTFNGELRPDKPILIYWLQSIAYLLLGDNPFAARFWSGIGGTVACLATWHLGQSMFDQRVGRVAAWVLSLSPMLIIESKLGTVDAVLLAFITLSIAWLWTLYKDGPSTRWAAAFWVCLGLGILTKGPIALAIPGALAVAFCAVRREWSWLRNLKPLWGVPLLFAIIAPWCIAVQIATNGEFLARALGHHVVNRAMRPLESHSGFPGYYVVSVLALMVPWSFLFPWVFWTHRYRFLKHPAVTFLACWTFVTLIIFELVRTKLVHYFLPAYPALAILFASSLVGRFADEKIGIQTISRVRVGWGMISMGAFLIVATATFAIIAMPQNIGVPLGIAAGIGGLGLILAGRLLRDGRYRMAFITQTAVGTLTIVLVGAQVLPALHSSQTIIDVADRLRQLSQSGHSVALWQYRNPSLVYNVGHPLSILDEMRGMPPFEDARKYAREHGPFYCPMTDQEMSFLAVDPALSFRIVERFPANELKIFGDKDVNLVEVKPAAVAQSPAKTVEK